MPRLKYFRTARKSLILLVATDRITRDLRIHAILCSIRTGSYEHTSVTFIVMSRQKSRKASRIIDSVVDFCPSVSYFPCWNGSLLTVMKQRNSMTMAN